jgi:hypothetical protein
MLGNPFDLRKRMVCAKRLSHPGFGAPRPGREIITKCVGTKSHTYDDSWYINKRMSHLYYIIGVPYKIVK